MLDKNPENFAVITYLWVLGLAMMGGVVSYFQKVQAGKKWSWLSFAIELLISAFAGLITFFICSWVGIDPVGTAALTGISGHFSSKSLALFEKIFDKVLGKVAE